MNATIETTGEAGTVIDERGYRPNVGIVICNGSGGVFWARRRGQGGWQFPQGGIKRDESPQQALYRELQEETGLGEGDVTLLARTDDWMHYRLPQRFLRRGPGPLCIGQKQLWFLLGLQVDDSCIQLASSSDKPEFDAWRWVDYWYPAEHVIAFKRDVYRRALQELQGAYDAYQSSTKPGKN